MFWHGNFSKKVSAPPVNILGMTTRNTYLNSYPCQEAMSCVEAAISLPVNLKTSIDIGPRNAKHMRKLFRIKLPSTVSRRNIRELN